jgi:hypothetical protein
MKKVIITALVLGMTAMGAYAQFSSRYLQFYKPHDKNGINVFETPKEDSITYQGLQVRMGGAFALQYQALTHSNESDPVYAADDVEHKTNLNKLYDLGPGFNLATANLNLDVQLEDGIRMEIITFLSARHHQESWVKGGYLQIDKMAFLHNATVDKAMQYLTIRVGHMEVNYGDAHFRRTDNGEALKNPFVGNYITDAYATEIGGELYFKYHGFLAMGGITNGEIKGDIKKNPGKRNPSYLGKIGYDNQVNDNLRVRLTGSVYTNSAAARSTLYHGDRAGSRYYLVMVNQSGATDVDAWTGRFDPSFYKKITAIVVNPFIKFHGLEFFGNFETAKGFNSGETTDRNWNQMAADLIYRIGANENFYIAARYNTVSGRLQGMTDDVTINRMAGAFGWFIGKNILAKVEYVNQDYKNFPKASIYNAGNFHGLMVEGAISF